MIRARQRNRSTAPQRGALQVETLERRMLLDVAGIWDELGWRSASGAGISWDSEDATPADTDIQVTAGESQLLLGEDGDPIVLWIEGAFNEYIDSPVPFDWEVEGVIYARQYAGDLGWWDLTPNSGDPVTEDSEANIMIGTGSQLEAVAGPNGQIIAAWTNDAQIQISRWDGDDWTRLTDGEELNVGEVNNNPSVTINALGEIFVSYTAYHSATEQNEIVVQKYGYIPSSQMAGPPTPDDLGWTELYNEEVGAFGENLTSGVSNSQANSYDSSIAVGLDGRPIVAWTSEFGFNQMDILLKRWDGDSWEEMGIGSASDQDASGNLGVSNDVGKSLQADVAVADNGDVIVAWVNWNNWEHYDTAGRAGVFVKVLDFGSNAWRAYMVSPSSSAEAGIAPNRGWWYNPKIDTTSDSYPFIVWQGFGENERYELDRDSSYLIDSDNIADHTPGLLDNWDRESPIMAAYGSYYDGAAFNLMANDLDPSHERANPYYEIDGVNAEFSCWMPNALVGDNDELIMSYTWRDKTADAYLSDYEIFVQQWNTPEGDWEQFGRGSMTGGNDVFGGPENSAGYYSDIFDVASITNADVQLGLVDSDNNPDTEMNVLLANGEHVYLFDRDQGLWSMVDPSYGYSEIFDLRGDPSVEYDIEGPVLLAYIDTNPFSDTFGSPFVYEWTAGGWSLVGGDPASPPTPAGPVGNTQSLGQNTGISVQAGPDDTILLAYVAHDELVETDYIVTRLWDGSNWTNAADGYLGKGALLEASYYATFDGYSFDDATLNQVTWTGGQRSPEEYTVGEWYFDPQRYTNNQDLYEFITGEINGSSGADYLPEILDADGAVIQAELLDNGLSADFAIPDPGAPGDQNYGAYTSTQMAALMEHQFRLIAEGYVVAELEYAADTLNTDMLIYLVVDSELVDADPTDTNPTTPLGIARAGQSIGYDGSTSVSLDFKYLMGEQAGLLIEGGHSIGVRAVNIVSAPDLEFTFPTILGEDELGGWTYVADPVFEGFTDGDWLEDAGFNGADDGGLRLSVQDGIFSTQSTVRYAATYEHELTLQGDGNVNVDLDFAVEGAANLGDVDTLDLYVTIVDEADGEVQIEDIIYELNSLGDYQMTSVVTGGANLAYQSITLNSTNAIDDLPAGTYKLWLSAVLSDNNPNQLQDSVGDLFLKLDNIVVTTSEETFSADFDGNPRMQDWRYEDVDVDDPGGLDPNDLADGDYSDDADIDDNTPRNDADGVFSLEEPGENEESGGLQMILGRSDLVGTNIRGAFLREFEMGGPVDLTFEYNVLTNGYIAEGEIVTIVVKLDGMVVTSDVDPDDPDGNPDTDDALPEDDPRRQMQYIFYETPTPQIDEDTGLAIPVDGDWTEVTINLEDIASDDPDFATWPESLFALASGGHTITLEAILSSNMYYGEEFHFNETDDGWTFAGDPEDGSGTRGEWLEGAGITGSDGGLHMVLGDGANEYDLLSCLFETDITLEISTGLNIDFAYEIDYGVDLISATDKWGMAVRVFYLDEEDNEVQVLYHTVTNNQSASRSYALTGNPAITDTLEAEQTYTVQIIGSLSHTPLAAFNGVLGVNLDDVTFTGTDAGLVYVRFDDIYIFGEQQGNARIDNFSVYQRVIPDPIGMSFDFISDPLTAVNPMELWAYTDISDPGNLVNGTWDLNSGANGAGDGALIMTLGDEITSAQDLAGRFTYDFTLEQDRFVDVNLSYFLGAGGDIDSIEALNLTITVASASAPGTPLITILNDQLVTTNSSDNTGWVILSSATDNTFLDAGDYTLVVDGSLINSAIDPEASDDLDGTDPVAGADWTFTDVTGNTSYNYKQNMGITGYPGDNALEMVLGDTDPGAAVLSGEFAYSFVWNEDKEAAVKFDYRYKTAAAVDAGDIIDLNLYLDDGVNPRTLIGSLNDFVCTGRVQDTGWSGSMIIDAAATLGTLDAGSYELVFAGEFTGYQPGDVVNIQIDEVSVHQKSPGFGAGTVKLDDVDINLSFSEVWYFDADPGNSWIAQDLIPPAPDPGNLVEGYWDDSAGPEGTDDGALVIVLGDGVSSGEQIFGRYQHQFTLDQNSFLDIEFDYYLETGSDIDAGETLDLTIYLENDADPGAALVTIFQDQVIASGGATHGYGWQTISVTGLGILDDTTGVLSPLAVDADYNLIIDVDLSESSVDPEENEPLDKGNPVTGGIWTFGNETALASYSYQEDWGSGGDYPNAGDNALEVVLGTGAGDATQSGELGFNFTWETTADMALKFDYWIRSIFDINEDDALKLNIILDDGAAREIVDTIEYVATENNDQIDTDWVMGYSITENTVLENVAAGDYTLIFEAVYENYENGNKGTYRIDDLEIHRKSDGQSRFVLDNLKMDFPTGTGDWEYRPAGGDVGPDQFYSIPDGNETTADGIYGGNDAVGPDPNPGDGVREGAFDFGGAIHSAQAIIGQQSYLIEDIYQPEPGDLVVGYRYRLDSISDTAMSVMIDGVAHDTEGNIGPINSTDFKNGWWNYQEGQYLDYTSVWVTIPNVSMGTHTIAIEINTTTDPATSEYQQRGTEDLWIDNLTVLTNQKNNSYQPIATLLPQGAEGGVRHFAVGATNLSFALDVYEDDTDVYNEGTIQSFAGENEFQGGYQSATIFELDSALDDWVVWGDEIKSTAEISFMGFWTDDAAFTNLGIDKRFGMPAGEFMYRLEDLAVGSDAMLWVALQRADTVWTDTDGDGDGDQANINPWTSSNPEVTTGQTTLDTIVQRWDAFLDPLNPEDVAEVWVDTEYTQPAAGNSFTNIQMVASPGQNPIVAYTDRTERGVYTDSFAERYEYDPVNETWAWALMETNSVQGEITWGSTALRDMIIKSDGFPIVSFYLGHLYTDGVREFRPDYNIPSMSIEEIASDANVDTYDGILNFGAATNNSLSESFNIYNDGPADLIIHDIQIDGAGRLPANAFTIDDIYPYTIENQDQLQNITVNFNPEGAEPGRYNAVLLIHSSQPDQPAVVPDPEQPEQLTTPNHPYGHFYEIILQVEILNEAQASVEVEDIDFGDVYINEISSPQPMVISNEGDDPLTVKEWFFIDNNFTVAQTILTDAAGANTNLNQTANTFGSGDDVVIPPDGYLTLQLVFSPDDLGFFDDIFHVTTDDAYHRLLTVPLTGKGLSRAAITIYETSGSVDDDDQLDLGRTIMGQTSTETFIIANEGATPLTIYRVWEEDNNTEITVTPKLKNQVLQSGAQVVMTVTYKPIDPDNNLEVEDLETRIRVSSDDPVWGEGKPYLIDLFGQAVPQVPIISVTETSNISNDNRLEFGTLEVGQQNSLAFDIQNIGGADLILDSFVVNKLITPFFTVPNLTAAPDDDLTLSPEQSLTVFVNFNPEFAGSFNHSLMIRSNNLDKSSVYEMTLLASAVELVLEVEDSYQDPGDNFIDFSVVPENQSVQHTISLSNHGTTSLLVNWSEIEDPGNVFTLNPDAAANLSLDPGVTEIITVTFTPQDNISYNGTVWITSPTLGEEWFISLLGVGAAPGEGSITDDETLTPHGIIDFTSALPAPLIAKYQTRTQSFTITNTGASDLVVEGILITEPWQSVLPDQLKNLEKQTAPFILDITGGNVSHAQRLDPDNSTDDITLLPALGQLNVPVTFAPQTIYSNAVWYVSILTNDPTGNNPIVTYVELTGESDYPMEIGQPNFVTKQTFPVDFSGDNWVTVKISGPGFALVVLENGTASGSEIKKIELFDTTEKTTLSVVAKQTSHLGQIVGGDVKNVVLKNVIVDGEFADGAAIDLDRLSGKLTMTGLSDGADININDQTGKGVMLDLGPVGDDSDVIVNGDIAKFNAAEFGDGTIEAVNIKNIKVNGGDFNATVRIDENLNSVSLKGFNVGGSFIVQGDVNKFNANNALFTGSIRADNIGKAAINSLLDADISVRNSIDSLKIKIDAENSHILAGYDLGDDGRPGGDGTAADNLYPGGYINNISIGRVYDGSYIIAGVAPNDQGNFLDPTNDTATGSIGKVKFNFVQFNNNFTLFGVAAHTSIDRVLIGNTAVRPGDPPQMDFDVMLI